MWITPLAEFGALRLFLPPRGRLILEWGPPKWTGGYGGRPTLDGGSGGSGGRVNYYHFNIERLGLGFFVAPTDFGSKNEN